MQRCCPEAVVDRTDLTPDAGLFKALADPARLTILATLARNADPVCVCDFTSAIGLNQSTVSHHLKILKDAGLIGAERRGTWVYYALEPQATARLTSALERILPAGVPA